VVIKAREDAEDSEDIEVAKEIKDAWVK